MTALLAVVEGERTEPRLLRGLERAFGMHTDVFPLRTNIHILYRKLSEIGFHADLQRVLLDFARTDSERKLLTRRHESAVLLFDAELQHGRTMEESVPETICRNASELSTLLEYFSDDTDPTRGMLYLDYPMVEAYRHCRYPGDQDFRNACVPAETLLSKNGYKRMLACAFPRMASRNPSLLKREELLLLMKGAILKSGDILSMDFARSGYRKFRTEFSQREILAAECHALLEGGSLPALNTMLLLPIDYYGEELFLETMRQEC